MLKAILCLIVVPATMLKAKVYVAAEVKAGQRLGTINGGGLRLPPLPEATR
jgi:hypothetical protein